MKSAVTRFAPSPTGHLHLGHAYSANIAWQSGEICPLRIEDIDPTRCKPEFETALYEDLAWLGFTWPSPVRRQSDHMNDYRICLEKLDAMGVLYPCFCTRKEIQDEIHESPGAPQSPNEHYYPGTCKKLSNSERLNLIAAGRPYALRLDSDRAYRMTAPSVGTIIIRENNLSIPKSSATLFWPAKKHPQVTISALHMMTPCRV